MLDSTIVLARQQAATGNGPEIKRRGALKGNGQPGLTCEPMRFIVTAGRAAISSGSRPCWTLGCCALSPRETIAKACTSEAALSSPSP